MSESTNTPPVEIHKDEEKLVLDHNYDGIKELDHVLPRWWLWMFYATIIFAAWYSGYYLSGSGPSSKQELAVALEQIDAMKPVSAPPTSEQETSLLMAAKDPEKIKHGGEVYLGKCFACHGDKAQGVIGPNLTDEYWIHGKGRISDLAAVIRDGVPDKGMPPWGAILTPDEFTDVVAFVHSVRGSNPAGAKAQQGELQEFEE